MRTAELYRGLLKNHITPRIGHLNLADPAPARGADHGRGRRQHPHEPLQHQRAGQHDANERSVATLEQVFALAEAIQRRYRLVVLLATFASLRYGKIMPAAK